MNKYNNIKRILRNQIDKGVKSLWTFDEEKKEFNYLYKRFDDKLKIYTPPYITLTIMPKISGRHRG